MATDTEKFFTAIESGSIGDIKSMLNGDPNLVDTKDKEGNTPLHYAVNSADINEVKLLLEHNADTTIKNNEGKTALDIAKENSDDKIVGMITQHQQSQSVEAPPSPAKGNQNQNAAAGQSGDEQPGEGDDKSTGSWTDIFTQNPGTFLGLGAGLLTLFATGAGLPGLMLAAIVALIAGFLGPKLLGLGEEEKSPFAPETAKALDGVGVDKSKTPGKAKDNEMTLDKLDHDNDKDIENDDLDYFLASNQEVKITVDQLKEQFDAASDDIKATKGGLEITEGKKLSDIKIKLPYAEAEHDATGPAQTTGTTNQPAGKSNATGK